MKYLFLLPILLLSACNSPQETSFNGRQQQIVWLVPEPGARLVLEEIQTDHIANRTTTGSDTALFIGSTSEHGITTEEFDYPTYQRYFLLEPNGDLIIGSDPRGAKDDTRLSTGGGSLQARTVTDSISAIDTVSYTMVQGFVRTEYVLSLGQFVLCPHIIDSQYVIRRFPGNIDTSIVSKNYWFDPRHGGYYARYTNYMWQYANRMNTFTEQFLVAYNP